MKNNNYKDLINELREINKDNIHFLMKYVSLAFDKHQLSNGLEPQEIINKMLKHNTFNIKKLVNIAYLNNREIGLINIILPNLIIKILFPDSFLGLMTDTIEYLLLSIKYGFIEKLLQSINELFEPEEDKQYIINEIVNISKGMGKPIDKKELMNKSGKDTKFN